MKKMILTGWPALTETPFFRLRSLCLLAALALAPLMMMHGQSLIDWKKIQTIEDVCQVFPDRMETLLQQINPGAPGLEAVKKALDGKQTVLACKLLLDYYRQDGTAAHLRIAKPASPIGTENPQASKTLAADRIIEQNRFTFYNQEEKVPLMANGHLDWSFHGPTDDIEWAWGLNRHSHLQLLLNAYLTTGKAVYAQTIDLHIKDWIIAGLPYPGKRSNTEMWRGLEIHSRMKQWARMFYALNTSGYLSPATQLLMLGSIPEHAHYLRNFHSGVNWLTMELSALATVATAWPEFKDSPEWFAYAVATMSKEIEDQVYPDGVQNELSSSYHAVAMNNFSLLLDICKQANQPLPDSYGRYIENMWNYLSCTMRPDGHGLLNSDSDLDYNRERVQRAAEQFRRDDWRYITTNGKEGVSPAGGPSFFFPWAGHLVMRSGYDPQAQWAFFDIGPWGSNHQHNDMLHLSVSAFGYDFLVDAGRFSYRGEVADKFRGYACSSAGHNVLLIDGKLQAPGPKLATEPLADKHVKITDSFDYAWHSFDQFTDLEGTCEHARMVFHVRGKCWVAVDRITTDRPRKIETLWHWHPECRVRISDRQIVTGQNEGGFLHVIPVGSTNWTIPLIKGQEKPSIQGWYSREYNSFTPNTASIYTTDIQKGAAFVWVLYPSENPTPDMDAKIISENNDGIVVQLTHPKDGQWTLTIPFADSSKALMIKK